jgi:hypothetical protein
MNATMLSFITQNGTVLCAIMISAIILIAIMLSAIMLSVVAPTWQPHDNAQRTREALNYKYLSR